MDIMDAAQDAHYKKLIVAGEPLNKKDQKKLEEAQFNQSTLTIFLLTEINSHIKNPPTAHLI